MPQNSTTPSSLGKARMHKKVYLCHDGRMALHRPLHLDNYDHEEDVTYENPDRIIRIYCSLRALEGRLSLCRPWDTRFLKLECIPAHRQAVQLVHSKEHYDRLYQTQFMTDEELMAMTASSEDLYYNRYTFQAASLACGGVIQCVEHVTSKFCETTRAIALVRPPGHHANRDAAMGFCYFNNIAVAAKRALYSRQAKRVFILDWDIHHGNGIQDTCYDDPNIFYVSIHRGSIRSSKNWFYPGTGFATDVGSGAGAGTNLNIVWGQGGMCNLEYAAAFTEAVLPALQAYQPDLILIACGLDAAKGDLLGDCGLSPDMYYTMTQSLLDVAGRDIPIVAVLEGGYNLEVSANCMEQVALALLGESSDFASNAAKPEERSIADILAETISNKFTLAPSYSDPAIWGGALGNFAKKTTRAAVASIKRSIRALAGTGVHLDDSHSYDGIPEYPNIPCSRPPKTDDISSASSEIGDVEHLDCHRPIKKRKVFST